MQTDLFGRKRISIPDNPTLEKVAEMILNLSEQYPEMLDGKTISEVDRDIRCIVWMENGLRAILISDPMTTGSQRLAEFESWHSNPQTCTDAELLTRARRYLVEHDLIRLSKAALVEGEQHRARLSRAFHK